MQGVLVFFLVLENYIINGGESWRMTRYKRGGVENFQTRCDLIYERPHRMEANCILQHPVYCCILGFYVEKIGQVYM